MGTPSVITGKGDRYAEIDLDLANRIAQIFKLKIAIRIGVDHDDGAAAPQYHLVQPQILEVTAIGELNPLVGVIGIA